MNVAKISQSIVSLLKFQALQPRVRTQRVRQTVALPMALRGGTLYNEIRDGKAESRDQVTSLS